MRRSVIVLIIALAVVRVARPARADDDAARARDLLAAIEHGQGDRAASTQELAAVAPRVIDTLKQYLARAHASTVEQRRAVLKAIKASVPDKSGKFETPQRQKAETTQADDAFDWLAALGTIDQTLPGLGEVAGDVAAIRALAATRRIDAATIILDAGFADATMIYRDDCGRRLRQMAPYSLPALTIGSQSDKTAVQRYASYQLERMDRQEPGKAMAATAGDEELRVAQLHAFGDSHHREAVATVLTYVNDDAPRVRAAAREAWLTYVTGPAPKGAPRKHLVLPGGKVDIKSTALWLTYRELATIELERVAEEQLGMVFDHDEDKQKKDKDAPPGIAPDQVDLPAISRELFAFYDDQRRKQDDGVFAEAKAIADKGDLVGAGVAFDRLLAANPDLPQRADTAPVYLALARSLEQTSNWDGAAAAYGKAYGVAPQGAQATDAEAGREYALGKSLEAAGKDGSANFRRAVALKPDYAPAKAAAARDLPSARRPWLLYAAAAGTALALAFLIAGLTKRRRTA